jgi:hypothetical protein
MPDFSLFFVERNMMMERRSLPWLLGRVFSYPATQDRPMINVYVQRNT